MDDATNGLNRHLLRRFGEIARPYWVSQERWRARGMLALLVLLLFGQTWFNVMFNEQTGEFTSAMAAGDASRFWLSIRKSVAILVGMVPLFAFYYFVRDTLGLQWRRWLTNHLLDRYFSDHAFYRLNAGGDVDNPDQRIAEDVSSFSQQSLYFLMIALGAVIQLAAFSQVLWSISHPLVFFLIGYAVFGSLVTALGFGPRLIGLNFQQLRREADFRFSLVRLRENAEAIALHSGQAHESSRVRRIFDFAFDNFRQILRWQLNLNLFQYGFGFVTVLLPSMIIAGDVISGDLEVGRAIQAAGAFTAILSALSVIVEHFEGLSRFAAGIDRLHGFSTTLQRQASGQSAGPQQIGMLHDSRITLDQLTVMTPDRRRTLIRDLTLTVEPGAGLMIVGASGGGKSSLLRTVAGLWNAGSGTIARPSSAELMFLPQQPYMVQGSLRSQLLYPDDRKTMSDEELLQLLARVNLADIAQRFGGLDVEQDWGKLLSVGEQQRLAFARVLLAKPRYVMLDEATSALDADNEQRLYAQLAATSTTAVSVSHRPAILQFHRQVLELPGDGSWRLCDAAGYRLDGAGP